MRVSKPPEERKREMLETAMQLFAQKGYEATTMTDIAKKMKVVSGLCYRYFKSKEELYQEALRVYAKECAAPFIEIMEQDDLSFKEYVHLLQVLFLNVDGKQKYHDFFHGEGNEIFHSQLEIVMLSEMKAPMIAWFKRMKKQKKIHLQDEESAALFILYGQMPIINDDTIPTEEKIQIITELSYKLISK